MTGWNEHEYRKAVFEKCRVCADDEGFELCTHYLCPLYKFKLFPGRHMLDDNKDKE